MGRFDEAIELAEQMWQGWQRAGASAAAWMSPSAYSLTIAYALRDDQAGVSLWHERGLRIGNAVHKPPDRRLASFLTFTEARIALHNNDFSGTKEMLSRAAVTCALKDD